MLMLRTLRPGARCVLISLSLLLLIVAAPGYAQKPKDAFIDIRKKTLKKEYKHLALAPIVAAPAVYMPQAMQDLVEQELLKRLDKAGFDILPPNAIRDIQTQFEGLLSELKPTADTEKAKQQQALQDHVYRELYYRHPVNGLVSAQVLPVGAAFENDKAQWHGASQKIKHKGDGLLKLLTGKKYSGTIAASSLVITISDRRGAPLYRWSGGIEVLMQRNAKSFETLPGEELWQKPKRVTKAVRTALKPL